MTDSPANCQTPEDRIQSSLSGLSGDPSGFDAKQKAALQALRPRLETAVTAVPEPLRGLHHMACTGGTLIAKALAAMPNTVMLSEIDPLSSLHLRAPKPPFFPTDLVTSLRYCPRDIADSTVLEVFSAGLRALRDDLARQGLRLVLRDHAHSQFCTLQDRHARPSVHEILMQIGQTLGVVTVRHPLDSYMSLKRNGWLHFTPDSFEEYCMRYLDFIELHKNLPVYKYETFVAEPALTTAKICADLALPFDPNFEIAMPLARLSGDSGRSGTVIAPRARPPVSAELSHEAGQIAAYSDLCRRLGYDAQLGANG